MPTSSMTPSIDKLNVEMKKYNDVYPADVFVKFWDGVHAVMSQVMDMTRVVAENPKIPSSVKEDARASGNRLVDALVELRGTDDFVKLAWRARCTVSPPCMLIVPLPLVTATGFRSLAIAVLRQAERTRETCEFILSELPGSAALIFSFNAMIDNWIASRIDAATGHLDPYISRKTEEAIEKASKEAEKLVAEAEGKAKKFAAKEKAKAKRFVIAGVLIGALATAGALIYRQSRKYDSRRRGQKAKRRGLRPA